LLKYIYQSKRGAKMEKIGIGIGIIIKNKENKILMLLRNDDAKKADSDMRLEGTWTLPSGKVKFGETIEEAGIRKTKQECNLDVSKIKVICVQNDVNKYAQFATFGLIAEEYSGNIKLPKTDELVKYDWFAVNDMPENTCIPTRKIIEKYLSKEFYNG